MVFKVTLWGTRGSLPAPMSPSAVQTRVKRILAHYASQPIRDIDAYLENVSIANFGGYGGHTTCFEIESGNSHLILDGGSALRRVGAKMMLGPCGVGKGEAHIILTHFHWDHLLGIPFFVPIFVPGNQIHFYSVQPELEEVVRVLFKKPFFPVPYEQLGSKIHFHKIEARKPWNFQGMEITPYGVDHPDPCFGYRFAKGGRAFGIAVDNEGIRTSKEDLGPDIGLYQEIDWLVFDAQYTLVEATERVNWGHCAAPIGIDLAIREKIPNVAFVHHDPAAPDEKIEEAEKQTAAYLEAQIQSFRSLKRPIPEVKFQFAWDGFQFEL